MTLGLDTARDGLAPVLAGADGARAPSGGPATAFMSDFRHEDAVGNPGWAPDPALLRDLPWAGAFLPPSAGPAVPVLPVSAILRARPGTLLAAPSFWRPPSLGGRARPVGLVLMPAEAVARAGSREGERQGVARGDVQGDALLAAAIGGAAGPWPEPADLTPLLAMMQQGRVGGAPDLDDPGPAGLGLPRRAWAVVVDPCRPTRTAAARALLEHAGAEARREGMDLLIVRSPNAPPGASPCLPDLPGSRRLERILAPWTLVDLAARLHGLEEEAGLLALAAGVPVSGGLPGGVAAAQEGGGAHPALARLFAATRWADPFRRAPCTAEEGLATLGLWREAAARNRRIVVCLGMQFWKRDRMAALFAGPGAGPGFRRKADAALALARRAAGPMPPARAEVARDHSGLRATDDRLLRPGPMPPIWDEVSPKAELPEAGQPTELPEAGQPTELPQRRQSVEAPPAGRPAAGAQAGQPAGAMEADALAGEADRPAIAAWATRMPAGFAERARRAGVRTLFVEDGFIRSVGLGAGFLPGASYALDWRGPYYDPRVATDLEHLLAETCFNQSLLARARDLRAAVVALGISKYNIDGAPPRLSIPPGREAVLVPGQVENDASVRWGGGAIQGNLPLLRAVRAAKPEAWIIYKPHPDVTAGYRPGRLSAAQLSGLADEVVPDAPIIPLIGMVNEVHTLTSQTGFEALLRERVVVTYGQPFYAGWGLSQDRHPPPRRHRRLTLDELVAGCLILYPRYLDPVTELPCSPEWLIERLADPGAWRTGRAARLRRWQGAFQALLGRMAGRR